MKVTAVPAVIGALKAVAPLTGDLVPTDTTRNIGGPGLEVRLGLALQCNRGFSSRYVVWDREEG